MPYVARKRLKVGEGYVEFGEEIPDFEQWSKGAQRRLLQVGHVEHVAELSKPKPKPKPTAASPKPKPAGAGTGRRRGGAATPRRASRGSTK